ncbi:hypothetical protein Bca52824_051082 [Brassica carinata]|uniref:Uncharacterized protein n=1 Tax=Brassica carinata TaxID=52824 RepID=A0A8X7R1D9_BRACI|nr:hypothetical protein Bca52824_051082 [Brassica carinata]
MRSLKRSVAKALKSEVSSDEAYLSEEEAQVNDQVNIEEDDEELQAVARSADSDEEAPASDDEVVPVEDDADERKNKDIWLPTVERSSGKDTVQPTANDSQYGKDGVTWPETSDRQRNTAGERRRYHGKRPSFTPPTCIISLLLLQKSGWNSPGGYEEP